MYHQEDVVYYRIRNQLSDTTIMVQLQEVLMERGACMKQEAMHAIQETIYESMETAYEKGWIDEQRKKALFTQCRQLAEELVLLKNRTQAASLSKQDHKEILQAISYIIKHGMEGMDEHIWAQKDVFVLYEAGLLQLQEEEQQLRNLWNELRRHRLPFPNDRYNSILDEQVASYLSSLTEYDGILHYHHCMEDLDYPLLDGLPLYHDMYHLDGLDLVSYYMQRFALEHRFCEAFRRELPSFITRYEANKGVSVEYLGMNLCELLWVHWMAGMLLFDKPTILLNQTDVKRLYAYLRHQDCSQVIARLMKRMEETFPQGVTDYLSLFVPHVQKELARFLHDSYALFVCEEESLDTIMLDISQTRQGDDFLNLLEEIEALNDIEEKIAYLKQTDIGPYDLMDILENDIFMGEAEYQCLYEALGLMEKAVLVKLLYPHGGSFHEDWQLTKAFLSQIDVQREWQEYLLAHIQALPVAEKQQMEDILKRLRIQS